MKKNIKSKKNLKKQIEIIDTNMEELKWFKPAEKGMRHPHKVEVKFEDFNSQKQIELVCNNLKKFLQEKNKRYGNSALSPLRVFSKGNFVEQIKVRIDDKISRIKNSNMEIIRKNDLADMLGYIVLLCIAQDFYTFDDLLD